MPDGQHRNLYCRRTAGDSCQARIRFPSCLSFESKILGYTRMIAPCPPPPGSSRYSC
jgi:hypothetical protein